MILLLLSNLRVMEGVTACLPNIRIRYVRVATLCAGLHNGSCKPEYMVKNLVACAESLHLG